MSILSHPDATHNGVHPAFDDEDCTIDHSPDRFPPDGIDDQTRWTSTQGWFEGEARRFLEMRSELGVFMFYRLREIAAEFALMDADSVATYEARVDTYARKGA